MSDQGFTTPTAGQADWDSSLNGDFSILERGYHVTEQAGMAINTGDVLWLNSGGFFFKFDPNSADIWPHAMAYTAAASGDSFRALGWGIVRSLDVHSAAVPGQPLFVSAATPGAVVGSYSGANRPIGIGLSGSGVMFRPTPSRLPERLTFTNTINAIVGSLHTFTMDAGLWGINRTTKMIGSSADLVELKFYSDSAYNSPLYSTISGGVSVVGSFYDRALWPYENTDASTLSGLVYGTLSILSGAAVTSDTIGVQGIFERQR